MKDITIAVYAVIGAVAVFLLALSLAVVVPMWETYWLHPTWAAVMVPLGLPAITYWQMFALNVLVSMLWGSHGYRYYGDEDERGYNLLTHLIGQALTPVVGYFVIRWAVGL